MRPYGLPRIALAVFVCVMATAAFVEGSARADERVPCRTAAVGALQGGPERETVQLRTLHVEAAPSAKSYKVGGTVKVDVTVTRPAEEDPTGSGVPLPSAAPAPVADVNVGVGVSVGDVFLPGFARTDAAGKATVKIKVKSYTSPGKADVTVYAYDTTLNTTCLRLEENGYRAYPKMFSIAK